MVSGHGAEDNGAAEWTTELGAGEVFMEVGLEVTDSGN